jgi:DNA topoisomerase-1
MAKTLVIVESPAKARTIKRYLGNGYDVRATLGHILDLPKSELGVDVENGFEPKYESIRGKKKVVDEINRAARNADGVLLASDHDREGEAIAWHIREVLKTRRKGNGPTFHRIVFNEITRPAIEKAVAHPVDVDLRKVEAQQARRVLDRLVGYLVSPILWQVFFYGLSAGRVQTVGLRLICEREDEIDAFVPREYWSLTAHTRTPRGEDLELKLAKIAGKKASIPDEDHSNAILRDLQGARYQVSSVDRKEKKRHPQPPFITSTLQRDAARRLSFSAKKTMVLAQQLYEGIDLGDEGAVGLITYMRTDSVRVAPEAQKEARQWVGDSLGRDYVPEKPRRHRTSKSAQDAHEAIRPTSVTRTPDSVRRYLNKAQAALYKLIWERFVASTMQSARFDATEVQVEAGKYLFRATGSIMTFGGFLRVYPDASNGGSENELPEVSRGEELECLRLEPRQHFTEPPPRYSESTLIKELEDKGIGRPSTYASIVSIIQDRGYVGKDRGRFHPTLLGRQVWGILESSFPTIFEVDFTARMETELDKVEEGQDDWHEVVAHFYNPFEGFLKKAEKEKKNLKKQLQVETDVECKKCGRKMIQKWGRNGLFLACPGYPKCKYTRPMEEQELEVLEHSCPQCGGRMVVKTGRYGRFAACENYPDCKYTESLAIGMDCPENGCDGQVVEKYTRRGKVFWGCSRYPDCEFASWDRPSDTECRTCGNPYMVEKETKSRGSFLRCPSCKDEIPL